ncbi:hypothetical protein B0H14DRAFT_2632034 [Mycena olivaceomarginata]|nr:hypothetical protein B0H14DRAFT_2632034 [Mycena olivaceomarginata]
MPTAPLPRATALPAQPNAHPASPPPIPPSPSLLLLPTPGWLVAVTTVPPPRSRRDCRCPSRLRKPRHQRRRPCPRRGATPAHTVTTAVAPATTAVSAVAPTSVPVASAVVAALDATRAKAAAPAAKAAASVAKAATAPAAKVAAAPVKAAAAPVVSTATTESVAAPASTPASTAPTQRDAETAVITPPRATQAAPATSSPGAPPAVMQTPATSAPTPGVPAAALHAPRAEPRPRLPPPAPNSSGAPPKSHAQKRKEKGKAKAKGKPRTVSTAFQATHATLVPRAPSPISPTPSPTHSDDEDFFGDGCTSYDLDADLDRALKMSVGQPTDMDTGASSSRRAATRLLVNGPPASPKRPRTDSSARDAPRLPPKRPRDDREDREEAQERRDSERRDAQEHRPTFNRYPPAYDTRDGNPPQGSFVPHHPLLTRAVYGMTGGVLFRNHPSGQLRQWNEVPQLKVVATISGGNGDCIQTAEPERSGPDPIAWLIAGLSVAHAQTLIDIGCLCSDTLTMFFHEYQPQITGFVGTFYGFTIPESSAALAHRTIVAAIVADPAIAHFIRAHRDTFPVDLTAEQCLVRFGEHIDTVCHQPLVPTRPVRGVECVHQLSTPPSTGRVASTPAPSTATSAYPSTTRPTSASSQVSPVGSAPTPETISALLDATREVLNPRTKKPSSRPRDDTNNKGKGKGPGKGKDRDDRKGGDRRRGN